MANAARFLTQDDIERLEAAIADAERRTGAEIVVAIATESGRYDRAESIVGLLGALAGLVAADAAAVFGAGAGDWDVSAAPLASQLFAAALGFAAGTLAGSHWHALRRLLTGRAELAAEPERAASHVFHWAGLGETSNRGGVLIYLSLFERRVIVRAEAAARAAAGDDLVARVCAAAETALRDGQRRDALLGAVATLAEQLANKFPAPADNPDEVVRRVVVIE
ncbi:MAG: hypothetical protein SF028_06875 [Candidatus Sumerlaeia bacterium]|nr:hypothetical protein [Candidatus Sumerlaeia bacterium]